MQHAHRRSARDMLAGSRVAADAARRGDRAARTTSAGTARGYPAGPGAARTSRSTGASARSATSSTRCCRRASYKPAWPLEDALAEIARQRGEQFDPELVDVFLDARAAALRGALRAADAPFTATLAEAEAPGRRPLRRSARA